MNWPWSKKDVESFSKKKDKTIEGWELKIVTDSGRGLHTYSNPDMKPLWKIYQWYLTRDSEKYNIEYNNGMRILHRHEIVNMELNKKQIKDIWSKDNETEI